MTRAYIGPVLLPGMTRDQLIRALYSNAYNLVDLRRYCTELGWVYGVGKADRDSLISFLLDKHSKGLFPNF